MKFKEFITEAFVSPIKAGIVFQVCLPIITGRTPEGSKKSSDFESTSDFYIKTLSQVVKDEVAVRAKPSENKSSKWVMTPYSGSSIEGHVAVKVTSPMLNPDKLFKITQDISKWISEQELTTTDIDSLFLSIYSKDLKLKFDPVKMILFLDGGLSSEIFDKQVNNYSPATAEIMLRKVKISGKLLDTTDKLYKAALSYLGKRSDGYSDFEKLNDGIIEFRVFGGAGYEHSITSSIRKMKSLVNAMEIACDPLDRKSEYLRKLSDLFSNSTSSSITKKQQASLPQELERLYRYDPEVAAAWKKYEHDSAHGTARIPLLVLIKRAMSAVKSQNTSLQRDEKIFLKNLISQSSAKSSDIDEYFGNDYMSRLKFKKEFML